MTNEHDEHDEQDEARTDSSDVGPDSGPPPPALAVPHSDEHRQDVPAPPEAHGFTQGQAERFATSYLESPSAIPTPEEEEAQYLVGGYDANMDAAHWFSLFDVDPDKAAMVLCQLNPNTDTDPDWPAKDTTTDQTGPRELLKLRQRFEDLNRAKPRPRTLRDWLHEAKEMPEEMYHSWIDEYVDAVALLTPDAPPWPAASAAPASQAAPTARSETAPTLTTPKIAEAFDGELELSAAQWRERLGDMPEWLRPARAAKGTAPNPSTWWPLEFARILLERGATFETLNRKFLNAPTLKPWLQQWQEQRRERNSFGQ